MLLQPVFVANPTENTVAFPLISKSNGFATTRSFCQTPYSNYSPPVTNFVTSTATYSPSLSPASTVSVSSEWNTTDVSTAIAILPPPPYSTAVANLNEQQQKERRFSGSSSGLEVHTDFPPQRAPSSGVVNNSSVFFSPYSQSASSCSTIRRESLDYSSDSFPGSKNLAEWKRGAANSELSSSLENIPMDELLTTPSPQHSSPYNFENVSEEEHEHTTPPLTTTTSFSLHQQQPTHQLHHQGRVGPSFGNTPAVQSQPHIANHSPQTSVRHGRLQNHQLGQPQTQPHTPSHQSSNKMYGGIASHHLQGQFNPVQHHTGANSRAPSLSAIGRSISEDQKPLYVHHHHHHHHHHQQVAHQQRFNPRIPQGSIDPDTNAMLELIDDILRQDRGEQQQPSRQSQSVEPSIGGVGSSPIPSTQPPTGSVDPHMDEKPSASNPQQPSQPQSSLQNPAFNLFQIKQELEQQQQQQQQQPQQSAQSSLGLQLSDQRSLMELMQQNLQQATSQQMPAYNNMLFGSGFNFPQGSSTQQAMEQFMPPQFKNAPFGSASVLATEPGSFFHSQLFGSTSSSGNTSISSFYPQGQTGSSGINLSGTGQLSGASLDTRRGSHGTTSSGSSNSHAGTPSPLSQIHSLHHHSHPSHYQQFQAQAQQAGSVFSTFRNCFDSNLSNPFSLGLPGAGLMQFGAGSADPSTSGMPIQVTSSSAIGDEQKLCAVCNDHAICQHYGARTCEGCKGFFKRTVQKKAQYVCAGNKNCPIDKRYRSRCQYCRFQKCLAVGMVKEVVRYGVLSGRRGRLPSKAKTSSSNSHNPTDQPPSPPLPLLTIIAKAFADTRTSAQPATTDKAYTVAEMMEIFDFEIQSCFNFITKIPDMIDIKSDQHGLLWRSFFPMFALKQAYRIMELNLNEATFIFENGQVAKLSSIPNEFRSLFEEIHKVSQTFRGLIEWDIPSFASLLVLQYLGVSEDGPRPNLADQASVDKLHSTIINALKDHCCNVASPQPNKLAKIVQQVSRFAIHRIIGVRCLEQVQKSGHERSRLMDQLYIACYDVRESIQGSELTTEVEGGQTGSIADQADLPASSGTASEKVGFRMPF